MTHNIPVSLQAEGAWSGRASHVYEAARLLMLVSVTPVTLADQGRWGVTRAVNNIS